MPEATHRMVAAARADDLFAVVAELHPGHLPCVPHQRAHLTTNIHLRPSTPPPCNPQHAHTKLLTSDPVVSFQIFTRLSLDPLTQLRPSGENFTDFTDSE